MNNIVKVEKMGVKNLADVKDQVQLVQEVLKSVMKQKTHYDTIPGCGNKPVLLKPGAEKILSTFNIGSRLIIEDLGDGYDYRYRVKCEGFHIPTGNIIGEGVGECSTGEKKYAWREAVCDDEFEQTPESRRQIYWFKDRYNKKPAESKKQVRTSPADMANTVLKMAKKRAQIDLCLSATACSDLFTQDLDEGAMQEHLQGESYSTPQPSNQNNQTQNDNSDGCISDKQANRLKAIINSSEYSDAYAIGWITAVYQFATIETIQWKQYKEICEIIEQGKIPPPSGQNNA